MWQPNLLDNDLVADCAPRQWIQRRVPSWSADPASLKERNTTILAQTSSSPSGYCTPSEDKSKSDSGFLSGASLSEDWSSSSASNLIQPNMLAIGTTTQSQTCVHINSPLDSGVDMSPTVSNLSLQNQSQQSLYNSSSTTQTCQPGLNDLSSNSRSNPARLPPNRTITLEDLIRPDVDGDTPLHLAVLQGFIEVVFSLVRILPHPSLLDIPNNNYQTALHLAVLTNQAPLVRRLVVGGTSVTARDRYGNTPLHIACKDGSVDCVRALCTPVSLAERQAALLRHAYPPQPLSQDLEYRNYDGQMCIHLAAMNGHVGVVQQLCWFGADVNAIEGKSGRTALHYAVERRQPTLLHLLVTRCGAALEAETYGGYSAYQLAMASTPVLAALLAGLGARARPVPEDSEDDLPSSSGEEDMDSDGEDVASAISSPLAWTDRKGTYVRELFEDLRMGGDNLQVA